MTNPAKQSTLLSAYADNPRSTIQSSRPKVSVSSANPSTRFEGVAELTIHCSSTPLKRQINQNNSAMSDLSTHSSNSSRSTSTPRPTLTSQYRQAYKNGVHIVLKQPVMTRTLRSTAVTPAFRAKMVNWMMEVFHKFSDKSSDRTLFRAVLIMDLFFKHYKDRQLTNDDVYLVGLTCIYVASKYSDTDYITLEEFRHCKMSKDLPISRILDFEVTLLFTLGFEVSFPTLMEFLEHFWETLLEGYSPEYVEKVRFFSLQTAKTCLLNVEFNDVSLEVLSLSILLFVVKWVDCSTSAGSQSFHHSHARISVAATDVQRKVSTLAGSRQAVVDTGSLLVRQHVEGCRRTHPGLDNACRLMDKFQLRILGSNIH